jgi:hypothetical protein
MGNPLNINNDRISRVLTASPLGSRAEHVRTRCLGVATVNGRRLRT